MQSFFAMDQSFLDPQISKDGTPYAPKRFKSLVQECWFICDNLHIGYDEVLDMSVTERELLIQFIKEKTDTTRELMEKAKAEASARAKSR